MYKDQFWIEDDDGNETLFWENEPRQERFGNDNNPNSAYCKMMELNQQYDFNNWENPELPDFWHYVIEISPRGKERRVYCHPLLSEFMST